MRAHFIGAASRHDGVARFMSSTAARLVTGTSLGNVVSVQVPLFRIIPGRYMTALWPSIGDWLSSVAHCPVRVSRIRVVVSGPASTTRPSGARNMNGYSGMRRAAPGIALIAFVAGS